VQVELEILPEVLGERAVAVRRRGMLVLIQRLARKELGVGLAAEPQQIQLKRLGAEEAVAGLVLD
jgi:hypothetical protein